MLSYPANWNIQTEMKDAMRETPSFHSEQVGLSGVWDVIKVLFIRWK